MSHHEDKNKKKMIELKISGYGSLEIVKPKVIAQRLQDLQERQEKQVRAADKHRSSAKLSPEQLIDMATKLVSQAEKIPLGSFAAALGKRLHCGIIPWPVHGSQEAESWAPFVFRGRCHSVPEYTIFFRSAKSAAKDRQTLLFGVARVLAHIQLQHDLKDGPWEPEEQEQAIVLALAILTQHGPPSRWRQLSATQLFDLLLTTNLSNDLKVGYMDALSKHVKCSSSQTFARTPRRRLANTSATRATINADTRDAMRRYRNDADYRKELGKEVHEAIARAKALPND